MKRLMMVFLCLIGLMLNTLSAQQTQNTAQEKAAERKQTLTKLLKLNSDQANQVYQEVENFWIRNNEIRKSEKPLKDKQLLNKKNATDLDSAFQKIFTKEQFEKLEQLRNKNKQKKKN